MQKAGIDVHNDCKPDVFDCARAHTGLLEVDGTYRPWFERVCLGMMLLRRGTDTIPMFGPSAAWAPHTDSPENVLTIKYSLAHTLATTISTETITYQIRML